MIKKRKKFIRRNWDKYSRLGRGRRKLQKWRRPK
jgi:ribosomal protein L32E